MGTLQSIAKAHSTNRKLRGLSVSHMFSFMFFYENRLSPCPGPLPAAQVWVPTGQATTPDTLSCPTGVSRNFTAELP